MRGSTKLRKTGQRRCNQREPQTSEDEHRPNPKDQECSPEFEEPPEKVWEGHIHVGDLPSPFDRQVLHGLHTRRGEAVVRSVEIHRETESETRAVVFRLRDTVSGWWVAFSEGQTVYTENAEFAHSWPVYGEADLVRDALHRRFDDNHLEVVEGYK